jgi:hypothetical protein
VPHAKWAARDDTDLEHDRRFLAIRLKVTMVGLEVVMPLAGARPGIVIEMLGKRICLFGSGRFSCIDR